MSAFSLFKSATELLVSAGSGAVVGNAIKASIPAKSNTLNKVTLAIGGFAISGMLAEMTSKYAGAQLDQVAENFSKLRSVTDELKSDVEDKTEELKEKAKNTKNVVKETKDDVVEDLKKGKDKLDD